MNRIMITGAGGQLGQKLIGAAKALPHDWRIFAYNRSTLDITRSEDIQAALAEARPDICFNAAAYTAVDRAEAEPEKAHAINVDGAGRLAAACHTAGTAFVHFSSDYVYADGCNRPLLETDPTLGTSVYARTKLEGEQEVMLRHPEAYVMRTSWVYAEYGQNFVRTMLRLGRERPELAIVADQIGSPTYAADLAAAAMKLAISGEAPGLYNYANSGVCSWYDLAKAVHEIAGIDCQVRPITTSQYPTPAKRPAYSVLNTQKISSIIGTPRHWRAALVECMAKIRAREEG
ncbi:dTDP-4-dehydrorhamnose reductase [Neolewinella litorea]|uniref:dTDP-4-dehydrorhamnose reductase n=1 Tax=Neolewinella litorea TaxID=2562452 RepID=A0A4S4NFY6_9BACT|nr:dTDP-4-dehydrorhamnose reductase [Neolewinella litorea]THH34980.1 dTDP-4-dehydrorhamnose reductase [Neolewinella litorea]